jgi:serine/threonine protein kinase
MLLERDESYLAPELLLIKKNLTSGNKIDLTSIDWEAVDIFSLGVTFFSSVFFTSPFKNGKASKKDAYFKHIFSKNYDKFWEANWQVAKILNKFK